MESIPSNPTFEDIKNVVISLADTAEGMSATGKMNTEKQFKEKLQPVIRSTAFQTRIAAGDGERYWQAHRKLRDTINPRKVVEQEIGRLQATPEDDEDRISSHASLTELLKWSFERTGDRRHLNAAVVNAEAVLLATPTHDLKYSTRFLTYRDILSAQRDPKAPDRCQHYLDRVEKCRSPNRQQRKNAMINMGTIRLQIARAEGSGKSYYSAVSMLIEAISVPSEDGSVSGESIVQLGLLFVMRNAVTYSIEDSNEAIKNLERARDLLDPHHHMQDTINNGLAEQWLLRCTQTKEVSDIETAISFARYGRKDACIEETSAPRYPKLLSHALYRRFENIGDSADLDSAIRIAQEHISPGRLDRQDQIQLKRNLATMLQRRYERFNLLEDLEAAHSWLTEIPLEQSMDGALRRELLSSWANLDMLRYLRIGTVDLLDSSVKYSEDALKITPRDHPVLFILRGNLSSALKHRFDRTGKKADRDRAIELLQETATKQDKNDPTRIETLSNLANITGLVNPKAAISYSEEVLKLTPEGHQQRASMLNSLGISLWRIQNYSEACTKFSEALHSTSSPPLERVRGARQAIQLQYHVNKLEEADRFASAAIELLPYICHRDMNRVDQQYAVFQTSGIASDACAISLSLGHIERAVEQLELGRGLILGYLIDNRNDLTTLKEVDPVLAQKYEELRNAAFMFNTPSPQKKFVKDHTNDRKDALRDLKALETEIRQRTELKTFLQPPPLDQLKSFVPDGHIVIVNVTPMRSDAIIVSQSGIDHILLPRMDIDQPEIVRKEVCRHRSLDSEYRPLQPRDFVLQNNDELEMDGLSWLWLSCVQPVLARLNIHGPPRQSGQVLPRIWWIGVGAATSLPFHAAGDYSGASLQKPPSALEWTLSSYTPTIKALGYARSRALRRTDIHFPKLSVLVVTMPETPGQAALKGVMKEADVIRRIVEREGSVTIRTSPTAAQVLAAVERSDIAHFACHGSSDPVDPSGSHLLLKSASAGSVDKLTVSALLDAHTESGAWVAYLSACSTAEVKAAKLAEEGIHLANAFQIAGFAHVIGSMHPVEDDTCAEVAGHFYRSLMECGQRVDANRAVAEALRTAVIEIRRQHPQHPSLWAPFIHSGA